MDFRQAFPELATAPNTQIDSDSSRQRDRMVRAAYRRVQAQGWENATLVSLHPFQLDMAMGYLGHITIPKKADAEPYVTLVIDKPRLDMRDLGDAKYEPIFVMPKELAADFCSYNKKIGGVFYFMGTGKVPADMLEAAVESKHKWYFRLLNEANENWSQHRKNPKYISTRMRDAAKELFRLKMINELPEWTVISKQDSPDTVCEGCGGTLAKVAKFCPACETIYDPAWVKVRRPDIWLKQNPLALNPTVSAAGAVPDIERMIQAEGNIVPPLKSPKNDAGKQS